MRQLLLVAAVTVLSLGCGERTTVKDGDVTVKDNDLKFRLPNLPGDAEKKADTKTELPSVAVLPFKASTSGVPSPSLTALADTLSASITRSLSRNEGLDVRAQSVVSEWRHNDPVAAGKGMKVRAVLVGEIKLVPDSTLVVSLELIEVATGRQLWGEVYKEKNDGDKMKEAEEKVVKDASDAVVTRLGAKAAKKKDK